MCLIGQYYHTHLAVHLVFIMTLHGNSVHIRTCIQNHPNAVVEFVHTLYDVIVAYGMLVLYMYIHDNSDTHIITTKCLALQATAAIVVVNLQLRINRTNDIYMKTQKVYLLLPIPNLRGYHLPWPALPSLIPAKGSAT